MNSYRKQLTIRTTVNMDKKIDEVAKKIGISKNAFTLYALDKALKDEERGISNVSDSITH